MLERARYSFLLLSFLLSCLLCACHAQKGTLDPAPREGVLLVAFGTSVPEARPAMDAVDAAFKEAFPGQPVVWAYTSQIIRKKIAAEGRPVGGISDGLETLAAQGCKVIRVQSLHVMAGEEFSALERALLLAVKKQPGRFEHVYLGRPMLESRDDAAFLCDGILAEAKNLRKKGEALVLMGHGQEHGRAGLTFEGVRAVFMAKDRLIHMATVEGSRGFDELLRELRTARVKSVVLEPLMLVAGDHARNDLCGSEDDSWASRLEKAGIRTKANLKGLGEIEVARTLLVRHAKESTDDLILEPRKQ